MDGHLFKCTVHIVFDVSMLLPQIRYRFLRSRPPRRGPRAPAPWRAPLVASLPRCGYALPLWLFSCHLSLSRQKKCRGRSLQTATAVFPWPAAGCGRFPSFVGLLTHAFGVSSTARTLPSQVSPVTGFRQRIPAPALTAAVPVQDFHLIPLFISAPKRRKQSHIEVYSLYPFCCCDFHSANA